MLAKDLIGLTPVHTVKFLLLLFFEHFAEVRERRCCLEHVFFKRRQKLTLPLYNWQLKGAHFLGSCLVQIYYHNLLLKVGAAFLNSELTKG